MPAEESRRRVNRTLGPQTRTVSCKLGKPSHKSIGQAVSCSGRFADFELEFEGDWEVETLARTEWNSTSPPAPELYGSSEGPEQRPRDIEARGGWEREREREKAACPAVGVPVTTRTRRVLDTTPCCPPALHARAVLPTHRPGSRAARTRPRFAPAPAARASPQPSTPPGRPVNPPPHARSSARAAKLDGSSPSSVC